MSGTFSRPFEVSEVQCVAERDAACSFKAALSEEVAPRLSARRSERGP